MAFWSVLNKDWCTHTHTKQLYKAVSIDLKKSKVGQIKSFPKPFPIGVGSTKLPEHGEIADVYFKLKLEAFL